MTTIQQALHIFKKDARALRYEIGGVLFLNLLLMLTSVETWEAIQEQGFIRNTEGPLMVLLPITWCLLIARAIQTEALPGDRHFWLTRPYSRPGLLLAKGMLILAFVDLPFLLAQAWIVARSGVPFSLGGLLWNQVLVACLILLPSAAIASLTRNLAQFLPATILLVAVLISALDGMGNRMQVYPDWVRLGLGTFLAGAVAIGALALQYWRRKTLWHAAAFAITCFLSVVAMLAFPASAVFALQSRAIGSPDTKPTLSIGQPVEQPDTAMPNRYSQRIEFPITLSGAIPDDVVLDASRLTLKTLSGFTQRYSTIMLNGPSLSVAIRVNRDFFEKAKDSPISVHMEYKLMQFGNHRNTAVPADGTPVMIPNLGQCGAMTSYGRTMLCRSAFRPPTRGGMFQYGVVRSALAIPVETGYSPTMLAINPLATARYPISPTALVAPAAPEPPIQVTVREPIAYFDGTLDVADVRLAGYAAPDPSSRIVQTIQ